MGKAALSDPSPNLAEELVAAETGAREHDGLTGKVIAAIAVAWSLFQLWYASPLPFLVARYIPVLNDTEARAIHLAFAFLLSYVSFPALKRSARDRVPLSDWVLGIAGAVSAGYLFVFNDALASRPGLPNAADLVTAGIGLVLLLEATRRTLGPPLTVMALIFLAYVFFGNMAPDLIAWKGASFSRAMSHLWITTEGVFGIALGVSTSFVFLFVLFGALLDRAGAGHYFIQVAFSLLGHMRGGPAKAAVLASGMTGLVSGSSIANTVTTGTFTIPLMKRVGFSSEKAGAVEVAASVNGQIMPPVMGAAAFLMVEYVGISYLEVITHAFLPAVISYIALIYIVHLEALKSGMEGLPRGQAPPTGISRFVRLGVTVSSFMIVAGAWYYGILAIQSLLGASAPYALALGFLLFYVTTLTFAARHPDLPPEDPNAPIIETPRIADVGRTGLHFILPIGVLVWCLMVERLSPGLAAFWATTAIGFILITQKAVLNTLRGGPQLVADLKSGLDDFVAGLELGAKNMVAIAIATAAAGIIVGAVSLTGVGQVLTELVEILSGGNLLLMLALVAILSIVLGMGLPTTANYIVVSALMAGVVVDLGAQNGLVVPLIAVHLFVFYFGIMADVTPPVGLASFAAAAISRADPIKTGIAAFSYSLRTVVLPFLFIFNTKLLLIGIEGPVDLALTVVGAVTAVLVFAAATQGYFVTRNKLWEAAALLLIAFTLFRPQYWVDRVVPPFETVPYAEAASAIEAVPAGGDLRLTATGETLEDDIETRTALLPLGEPAPLAARLEHAGLILRSEVEGTFVDDVVFGGPAAEAGIDFDWEVVSIELPSDQPNAYIMYVPAGVLLFIVWMVQRRRRLNANAVDTKKAAV
jgi:TRAP transporter 4TM/12TM fusion protein